MKIFLTGASGFIGRHLVRRLLKDGHTIVANLRSLPNVEEFENLGVEVIQDDLLESNDLTSQMKACDTVIHCAALVGLWALPAQYQTINIELTKKLLGAAKESGIKRFIFLSCANVVLNKNKPILNGDESLPYCNYQNFQYARSKAIAEQLVLSSQSKTFKTIAIRPAFVWGVGDMVDRKIGRAANAGKFGWFDGGHHPYSTCYVGNLSEAISSLVQKEDVEGAFFISDDETVDLRDFLSERLSIGGYAVPSLSLPKYLAWPLARFAENGWSTLPLKGEPPLVREAVRTMGYPFTVSNSKAKSSFAYRVVYTIKEGMEEIKKTRPGN